MDRLRRELETASALARDAGAAAMAHYGRATAEWKHGGSPVTGADHAANRVIVDGLREAFEEDAVLSEESRDRPDRLQARRVWIVDPLDGTREFLSENGEFSIMIGLAIGGAAVLGVVYRPVGDRLYGAVAGAGAWVEEDGRRRVLEPGPAGDRLRMVGSRSHDDPLIERIRVALGIDDVTPSGSVGLKCALLAEGERDVYVHPVPYLKEWDTCAPELLVRETGGTVTDCRGETLRYNKTDPRQPHGILALGPGAVGARETVLRVYAAHVAAAR